MVAAALQDTSGVLPVLYEGNGLNLEVRLELAMLALAELPIINPTVRPGSRCRAILAIYKKVHKCRPIVVIDINEAMAPATLSKLLLEAKQLGFEEYLATLIFVVTAPWSALGLPVSLEESRVRGYRAPDFTEDEALTYAAKHLSAFPDMTEFVVKQIGTRAMHLVSLCRKCQGAESETECRRRLAAYRTARIDDAALVLLGFVAIAQENETYSKDASLAFFKKLKDGTPVLDDGDAWDAFGFDDPDLLFAALAKWPAFPVDPFDHTISMQSHFMKTAIDEDLQAEAVGAAGTNAPSSV
ncbi:hypothetical protein JKP88DRAFT_288044 [Tribonema minus]|uniref:Uncharacterized protein n=1 Tax=Tribonema minus TaxID=303371 RepID=A0A836CJC5_9STRA|nr:hypothetical protein JKP88DRAFT_288044 [Tribonema minus]